MYSADLRKHYDLKDPQWRYDIMPEVINGHNVADFIDPDIDAKLLELEREEEEMERAHAQEMDGVMEVEELTEEQAADLAAIRTRKASIIREHRQKKGSGNNRPVMPAKAGAKGTLNTGTLRSRLGGMGLDPEAAIARARSQSRGRKRTRSDAAADAGDVEMDEAGGSRAPSKKRVHSSKSRSMSRGRALSLAEPSPNTGLKDAGQKNKGIKMADKAQRIRNKMARIGEADRVIATKMPKHLFSGKRGKGKTDRR